jgi:hypothetical protein
MSLSMFPLLLQQAAFREIRKGGLPLPRRRGIFGDSHRQPE